MTTDAKNVKTEAPNEIVEPLTDTEAAFVATVGQWREERTRQLEIEWQRVLTESNQRIAPVLRAHGITPGSNDIPWDIVEDEHAKTGWSIVKKLAPVSVPVAETPVIPMSRASRRRNERTMKKAVRKGGR